MTSCINQNKFIQNGLNSARDICKKHDLRFTNLRETVFLIILENHNPSKAYDILKNLQKEDSSAKPSTVYRTLDFLLKYGLIHKLYSSNTYVSCKHPLRHNKCSFLICNRCNEAIECCDNNLFNEIKNIGNKNNFFIQDIAIEIKGICKECLNDDGESHQSKN